MADMVLRQMQEVLCFDVSMGVIDFHNVAKWNRQQEREGHKIDLPVMKHWMKISHSLLFKHISSNLMARSVDDVLLH